MASGSSGSAASVGMSGFAVDIVIVNLYNAKIDHWFEQRQIGDDDEVEELFPPC